MNQNQTFKRLVAANRDAGRLQDPRQQAKASNMLMSSMRLWPDELKQAQELALGDDRSVSAFLRRTYLRGLELVHAERARETASQ